MVDIKVSEPTIVISGRALFSMLEALGQSPCGMDDWAKIDIKNGNWMRMRIMIRWYWDGNAICIIFLFRMTYFILMRKMKSVLPFYNDDRIFFELSLWLCCDWVNLK